MVMERSAFGLAVTVVLAEGVLPEGFGSAVVLETFAVFVMIVPVAVPAAMCRVMENVAEPTGNKPIVQLIVPVPPTAGLLQENAGPVVCVSETKVVLAGVLSVSETAEAADGPLLVSVTV